MLSGYLAGKLASWQGNTMLHLRTATHFQGFVKTLRRYRTKDYTVSVRIITVKHLIVNSVIPGNLVLSHTHTHKYLNTTQSV